MDLHWGSTLRAGCAVEQYPVKQRNKGARVICAQAHAVATSLDLLEGARCKGPVLINLQQVQELAPHCCT